MASSARLARRIDPPPVRCLHRCSLIDPRSSIDRGADAASRLDRYGHRRAGDGTILLRVVNLQNAPSSTKVGVMMRDKLSSRSKNAFLFVSPSSGIRFQRRSETGAPTTSETALPGAAPLWLRLDRRGSTIVGSSSADGITWTATGSASVPMNGVLYVGLAVTSGTPVAAAAATFSGVVVTSLAESGGPLPPGWSTQDVGSPAHGGAAAYEAGTFAMIGGGADIAGASDQFRFAYMQADGDLDIVARVGVIGDTHPRSRAGVMIRESLAGNSAHASMFVSSSRGITFQRRPAPGGTSVSTPGSSNRAPTWVKLSLRGAVVTAYESADATSWTTVGTQTVTLPSPFYVGLAVTSRDDTSTVTTNIDGVQIQATAGENELPTVSLSAPLSGETFAAPAAITVSADAGDTDGTIARIDFYQGTTLIGSDTTTPYIISWRSVPAGTYSVTAQATDDDGSTTTSAARTVTVTPAPNQPPAVSVTAPANGATFTAPATMTVDASASDADGTVARVDFYQGTTLIGSDTTSPYSISWSTVPAGTYALTARATDDDGATATSAARTVTVNAPANQAPAVALTAPANGATFIAPATITVSATASDTDGTIARVDFYQGTTPIGSDTTSPYSIIWSNVPAGSYSLTARAVDDDGATTASLARSVTVNPPATQRTAAFTSSPDHATLVNSYLLEIFAAAANPATATPIATQSLGKPAPVGGEITADVTSTINGIAAGTYQATVAAVGDGGMTRSTAASFAR